MGYIMKDALVAGIPRSGTTWLFRSLAGLGPGNLTPKGEELEALPIMKVHSLAPPKTFNDPQRPAVFDHCRRGGKCIFIFGDVVESVISTKLKRWNEGHAVNCGYHGPLDSVDIYRKDTFQYEKMFDTWMRRNTYPILAMRYETMDRHLDIITSYLEREIQWNPWQPRTRSNRDSVEHNELAIIEKTYCSLIEKVKKAPDVALFWPRKNVRATS